MRYVILYLLFAGIAVSCGNDKKQKTVKKAEVSFTKHGELSIHKQDTDSIITTLDIEIADDDYKTQTGLMYRKSMKDNRGMLFVFPDEQMRSFYMKNTEFAIDIIYANAAQEIVSIHKNAQPFDQTSLPSNAPTQYVLEVNAGLSDRWQLEPGDVLKWNRN